jgi:dUTP pyrophosphatase
MTKTIFLGVKYMSKHNFSNRFKGDDDNRLETGVNTGDKADNLSDVIDTTGEFQNTEGNAEPPKDDGTEGAKLEAYLDTLPESKNEAEEVNPKPLSHSKEEKPHGTTGKPGKLKASVVTEGVASIKIGVKKVRPSDMPLPTKPYETAASYDLCADLTGTSFGAAVHIPAGQSRFVPTNLIFDVPFGYEIHLRQRTGYTDDNILIQYAPCAIDSEYKEELKVLVVNTGKDKVAISHGQKVASFALVPILNLDIVEKE